MYIRGGCINHLCYFIKPDQVLYLGEALIEHSHEEIAPLKHMFIITQVGIVTNTNLLLILKLNLKKPASFKEKFH